MLALICYFFPAVISVWMFEALAKSRLTLKQCIYRFCGNALFINFILIAVKKFILNTAANPLITSEGDMLPSVAFNYLIMVVPIAALLALFEVFFLKMLS